MFSKIQTRISLLLIFISAFFIVGIILISNSEKDKFENVLKERTIEKEQLVGQVISALGENLRTLAYDYSYWDDMLKFLSTGDRNWAYVNIVSVMPTFKANAMWVYKKDFTLVYSTDTLNAEGLHEFPLEKETLRMIVKNNWFPHFFLRTRRGIMEVRGAPIQPSADIKRQTIPKGFLFACRFWDKKYLKELSSLSASDSTELIPYGYKKESIQNRNPDKIIYTSEKILIGWDGSPVGIFLAKTEFPMMGEVIRREKTDVWINITFAFVIIFTISLFLLKYVITPIKKISGSVENQDPSLIHSLLRDKTEFGKLSKLIDNFFRQKSDLVKEIEERKLVQSELQEKVTTLQLLKALHNAFQRALDLKQIYDLVYETIPIYFSSRGIQRASLLIYEAKTNTLISDELLNNDSQKAQYSEGLRLSLNESISGKCFSTGEIIIIEDCSNSPLIPHVYVKSLSLKACVAIPIKYDNIVLGVLRLDNIEGQLIFSQADIELFLMISEQLGVVIQNAKLFTEQKHIEEELRRSEEMYRTIFENTGTALMIVEEDATIGLVNQELERLSGYKAGEITGKRKWTEFVMPDDVEWMKSKHELRRLNPENSFSRYEISLRNRAGNIGYYINNVSMIPGTKRSIASLIDITERKRAEEELRKFSYVVENTQVSVMITDPEGIIEYINPHCLKVTGYCASEVLGRNPRFLKSGETSAEEYSRLWTTIKNGKQWLGLFHNKKKNGELYWENISISPIKNVKGEIIHFIAIREDITEWKEIESELKAAKEKAEASDRLKSEFLAQMSHEIRTPINTILSYSALIRSELESNVNDEMKFCFRNVASAGERIIRTIDLILNMSELQTGSYEYSPRSFDLYADVLERIYSSFLQLARDKKLQLKMNRNTLETCIIADEYSISQILINLVDNAIKYTNEGSVSISISRNSSSLLVVEISDTGIGINNEFLPHLFSPFLQEEQGYTRRFEGNGLGLALVKKYCELNNLQIEVQTKKYYGTTFRLIFPTSNLEY